MDLFTGHVLGMQAAAAADSPQLLMLMHAPGVGTAQSQHRITGASAVHPLVVVRRLQRACFLLVLASGMMGRVCLWALQVVPNALVT
jgi:hypothetical protein